MRPHHALPSRTVRGWLLVAALMGGVQVAHAYYTNGTPPAGFSGSPGAWTFAPKTSAEAWLAKTASTTTTLNVGGKTVTMNALLRLSSQAPRAAAKAMFGGPLALTATALALLGPLAISYFNGQWQQPQEGLPVSTGYEYSYGHDSAMPYFSSPSTACQYAYDNWVGSSRHVRNYQGLVDGYCTFDIYWNDGRYQSTRRTTGSTRVSSTCPAGWYITPAGCVQDAPPQTITEEEFTEKLLPYITPEQVPNLVPADTPLPVDLPIINPGPGDFPQPQVRRIPLGDFVPQPAPTPTGPTVESTQYRQPILDLVPSPTQTEPWRVDAQPKDIVKEVPNDQPAPEPINEPVDVPTDNPAPSDPDAKTESKTPGLCEMYPDILACSKPDLDTPEEQVPKRTEQITYTELNLWSGGSCPSNVSVSVNGQSITALDMANMCDWISTYLQPMVIFGSAMSAMFILMGSRGGDSL